LLTDWASKWQPQLSGWCRLAHWWK